MISSNFTTKNSDGFFRFNEQCACIIFGQEVLQPFWPGPVLHCWPLFDHDSLECGNAARWSIRMWPLSRQEQIIYRTVMTTKIPPSCRLGIFSRIRHGVLVQPIGFVYFEIDSS